MNELEKNYNIMIKRLGDLPIDPLTFKNTLDFFQGDLKKSLEFLVDRSLVSPGQAEFCLTGVWVGSPAK
jgi:hypothetical protein